MDLNVTEAPDSHRATWGPVIHQASMERILQQIQNEKQRNDSELLFGGQRMGNQGAYVQPTVFTNVSEDSPLAKEEIFGPVLCIMKP
jgi:acyl-CoA reductase-like NAD-dependent aldehyde dehydrogenase